MKRTLRCLKPYHMGYNKLVTLIDDLNEGDDLYIIRIPEKFVSLSGLIRKCVGIMKMLFVIKANKVMCYNTCVP